MKDYGEWDRKIFINQQVKEDKWDRIAWWLMIILGVYTIIQIIRGLYL
jgi:hypothetical protein